MLQNVSSELALLLPFSLGGDVRVFTVTWGNAMWCHVMYCSVMLDWCFLVQGSEEGAEDLPPGVAGYLQEGGT
jgi:hypothetical protein